MRDFVRLGRGDQARFAATWSLLGFCRLAIAVLPFSLIRRALGEDRAVQRGGAGDREPITPLDERQEARAASIGNMIAAAAAHTPWRSECYPQALSARALLGARRIPHRISFGVRRREGGLAAHVWVRAGGVAVTGGAGEEYTEVAAFDWAPRAREPR